MPAQLQEQAVDPASQSAAPADVLLEGVRKEYGDVVAVDDLTLEIARGEFFTMLGPSGSGKTTTLRLIAGFEQPDAGRVVLAGQDVTRVPPYDRNVNTVFQDYALFPHMTVAENVGYGLKIKRVGRKERTAKVEQSLEMVACPGLGSRKPRQLSGGQRQRVALARAIVNEPEVLLLDEPLGALDLKLRQEMQIELKRIQREVGITFVYVTHDQEEALTMSDRVAVFNHGRIEQVAPPAELYEHPANEFVASFVGISNVLVREQDGRPALQRPAREDPAARRRRRSRAGGARRERADPRSCVRRSRDALRRGPRSRRRARRVPPEPGDDLGTGPRDARLDRAARVAPGARARTRRLE